MLLDDYQKAVVQNDRDKESVFDLTGNISFLATLLASPSNTEDYRYISDLLKNTVLLIAKLGFNLDTVAQNSLK